MEISARFSIARRRPLAHDRAGLKTAVRKICCQGCGATLPVSEELRYLTCNYCDARLEIVQDSATTYARLLDEIADRTRRIESKLDAIHAKERLQALDEAWQNYLASVSNKGSNGKLSPPSQDEAFGLLFIGIFVTVIAAFLLASASLWLIPPVIALGLLGTRHFYRMSMLRFRAFDDARSRYETRRLALTTRIAEASRPAGK